MPEQVFTLDNAEISLYRSNAAGNDKAGDALYAGACAYGLRLAYSFDEVESWPTGSQYAVIHHINEQHEISIERLWLIDSDGNEFEMERNALYVLEVKWVDHDAPTAWRMRTYYGVTNRSANLDSQSVHEFVQPQVFRARWFAITESA